jgi:hypothetical protein
MDSASGFSCLNRVVYIGWLLPRVQVSLLSCSCLV